jgi:cell division protein FtsB
MLISKAVLMARSASISQNPRRRASEAFGASAIRWDRLGRTALLVLLGGILLLYVSPAKHWWEQSRTAASQSAELQQLEAEHAKLEQRAAELRNPSTLELEARKLGMVQQGERAYVIENAERR